MKKQTFLICGVLSLIVVALGFVATFLGQALLSYFFIAVGAASFWLVLRKAKKESWFGKPVK
jgi:antibiotic biosynthesis monooxygenase (ABM) superfamily enzyme